jgi:translation initiation factor IF-3
MRKFKQYSKNNEDSTRRNRDIRVPEVRLIDENGEQAGIVETRIAQTRATDVGLDLVEVSPTAKPPVCRIMDYSKFRFEKQKKEKANKTSQPKLKEIKFHSNISDNDYSYRIEQSKKFFEKGHKVKFSIRFRGRENTHKDLGFKLFDRIKEELIEDAVVDSDYQLERNNLHMILAPKR